MNRLIERFISKYSEPNSRESHTPSGAMALLSAIPKLFEKKEAVIVDEEPTLFEPASWLEKIHFINQFMLHNNVLISILGLEKCGKTTFARLMQTSADIHTVMVTVNATFSRSLFLEQLCSLLHLSLKTTFTEIMTALSEQKSQTLVIIDNAECLPESLIQEVLDTIKQQERDAYFHVCLVSDFSLVNMTSRLANEAYPNMIHSIELQPLTKGETRDLILEYFPLKNEAKIDAFFELTQGRISDIATHMRDFFSRKPGQVFVKLKLYAPLLLALSVFIICLFYFLMAPEEDNSVQSIPLELPIPSAIPAFNEGATFQAIEVVSLRKVELDGEPTDAPVVIDKVLPVPKNVSVQKQAPIRKPYTLQLMASGSKVQLNRLAQQYTHESHLTFKVIHTKRQGTEWYVLTVGRYRTKEEAANAMSTLPIALARLKPWVRRI